MDLNNTKWKIKKTFELLSKGTKSYFKSSTERRNNKYYRYWRHKSLKENTILYESFYGRGMLCGPLALFNAIIDDPEYAGYKHIWVLDEPDDHKELIERCKKKYRNISFVKFGSKQYIKYLASAKYLINNVSFYGYFVKRPGQVYINTWHGIPLKHLCHDEPTGPLNAFNMTRNFLHADYVLSANPFLTEIYLDAFKMRGLATGKIIEEGYPRLDTLVNTNKEDIYDELRRSGVEVDPNKKIILYAPTWRGSSYGKPDLSVEGFEELKRKLDESIDTEKYQVLVKVHQVVYSLIKDQLAEYNYIVPATMDANVILGITDILISDYSSIYFDYLATGRPVLFYITDAESYTENRGMYFGLESFKMMSGDKKLEIIPLLRPFAFGLILMLWNPFIETISYPGEVLTATSKSMFENQIDEVEMLSRNRYALIDSVSMELLATSVEVERAENEPCRSNFM